MKRLEKWKGIAFVAYNVCYLAKFVFSRYIYTVYKITHRIGPFVLIATTLSYTGYLIDLLMIIYFLLINFRFIDILIKDISRNFIKLLLVTLGLVMLLNNTIPAVVDTLIFSYYFKDTHTPCSP